MKEGMGLYNINVDGVQTYTTCCGTVVPRIKEHWISN